MRRSLIGAVVALTVLTGCASSPAVATRFDRTKEGVEAALRDYEKVGLRGDRDAATQKFYCEEIITREEADTRACSLPYQAQTVLSWKEITDIVSVTIQGDTAWVTYRWRGKTEPWISKTTDTFKWEKESWRYEFSR